MKYLRERRKALGGYQPFRNTEFKPCQPPARKAFEGLYKGTSTARPQSTTLAWVDADEPAHAATANVGKLIVPIVPDEGQTFGMPPMYKAFGIYSAIGQLYNPVDKGTLTEYRESTTGQVLQEGINEAGAMADFDRRRDGVQHPRGEHHPVLHLLLDVRVPAGRRPDLGRRRQPHPRVPDGGDRRPDHAQRRGPPARGRAQPPDRPDGADLPGLRPGLRLRAGGHHRGRHQRDVRPQRGVLLLPDGLQRELRHAGDARRGRPRGHRPRPLPVKSVKPDGAKHEVQLLGSGVILNEVLRRSRSWPRSTRWRARSTA